MFAFHRLHYSIAHSIECSPFAPSCCASIDCTDNIMYRIAGNIRGRGGAKFRYFWGPVKNLQNFNPVYHI